MQSSAPQESKQESKSNKTITLKSSKKQVSTPQELTPVVAELEKILSSITILKFKTQSFHWNVEGPNFEGLHSMFEHQYKALEDNIDLFAERIRALGFYAPHSLRALTIGSFVDDAVESKLNWKFMVETLRDDHKRMSKIASDASKLASEEGDTATANMLDELTAFHEKSEWMLEATLRNQ